MFKCCTDLSKKGGKFKKNATKVYDSLGATERTALVKQYIDLTEDQSVEGQTALTKFVGQYAQLMLASDEDFEGTCLKKYKKKYKDAYTPE